jgi:molybdenum cofactor guanylyltransferase
MPESEKRSAIILAGGRASRMGGVDKAWLMLADRPLLAWVCDRIRPQVGEIVLSVNSDDVRYTELGYPLVRDEVPGYAGPLAGLAAGLARARHDMVVTVPCDTPVLPEDLVSRLYTSWRNGNCELAVARTPDRIHHAIMLCSKKILPDLRTYLAKGERKVGAWQAAHRVIHVEFDDGEAFLNLNTPEDLAAMESRIGTAA